MYRIPHDDEHDVLILIPTIGTPRVLVPAFARLIQHLDGLAVHIVLSINPKTPADGKESALACLNLWQAMPENIKDGCTLTIYQHPGLAGFGGAINLGLQCVLNTKPGMHYITTRIHSTQQLARKDPDWDKPDSWLFISNGKNNVCWGLPPMTIIYNDDLVATRGWLEGMLRAVESKVVYEWSELPRQDPETKVWNRPERSMADYGNIGLVGPVSNCAAGIQQIQAQDMVDLEKVGWDAYAAQWRARAGCTAITATFLSGFCLGITEDCINALATIADNPDGSCGFFSLFDERYIVAGYEDNDLAHRADIAGFRAVVAGDTFMGHLGHQSFDTVFPDWQRGMRNRLVHYNKWHGWVHGRGRKLVAAYRVRLDVPHDLAQFRVVLRRVASLVDGVVVLLTANPAKMLDSGEYIQAMKEEEVPTSDQQLLRLCLAEPDKAQKHLFQWVSQVLFHGEESRFADAQLWKGASKPLIIEQWHGEFNERDERNYLLGMAEKQEADWVLSVDHDEMLEPRCTRAHLERLMLHPDPAVQQWDLAFINHWENSRMYRIDRPWGDGGTWTGGMRGFRLYRVNTRAPRRILAGGHNGLHCGNIPGADAMGKRVSGLRFRHLGYVRVEDRYRKEKRYNVQDPNPDPLLVGGTSYAHITQDEGMMLAPFVAKNGIGLHILVYERESADDLGRLLDQLYGVVDEIVLVWTGQWSNHCQGWLETTTENNKRVKKANDLVFTLQEWYQDGPSQEMACMAAHFGCKWVHHPLEGNLGAARNAGIQTLHGTPGLGWALFVDPDEQLPDPAPVHLRRMAESSECWGWMQRFINRFDDGGATQSESVRMSRLDDEGRMRLHGRVHESFAPAIRKLVEDGFGQIIRTSPFIMLNTGLARSPQEMQDKLEFYRQMTEEQLAENPNDPSAWITLGLYWLNEECLEAGRECLERAVACSDQEYLPHRELGLLLMRMAQPHFQAAAERMDGHSMQAPTRRIVEFIEKAAPPIKQLGEMSAAGAKSQYQDKEALGLLPAFPGR